MAMPEEQQDELLSKPWVGCGNQFSEYTHFIVQIYSYLKKTKRSDVKNLYILEFEDFITYLHDNAGHFRWNRNIKAILTIALKKVNSLAYIIKHEKEKRSSDEFFGTLTEFYEIMNIMQTAHLLDEKETEEKLKPFFKPANHNLPLEY